MRLLLIALLAFVLLLPGCITTTPIKDILENPDNYMGQTVTVAGTSSSSIKIGKLSGFTLTQDDGSKMPVSSETLPKNNSTVTVTGVVMKDTIFGTYILAKEIR